MPPCGGEKVEDAIEPWRRTGPQASRGHFKGLMPGMILEAVAYDDGGQSQGTYIVALTREDPVGKGNRVWLGHPVACSDEYYHHWLESERGELSKAPKATFATSRDFEPFFWILPRLRLHF